MQAPFQTEYDHLTFFKAVGDIIRANPHTQILLAGRGIQRGNAPLMALVGGGTLATRVRLLGEWSDSAALFNACDVVCSTSLNDEMRMTLAMAMLCGITCVATGMGAQGEVVGDYGVSVEPGSQASLTRGITRVMEMPPERRAFLARGSRQHALANFNLLRSLQRHHDLYAGSSAVTVSAPERAKDEVATAPADQLTAA
jgi:glycosyltransferase involved in cell wall biosynthesis